MSEKKLLLPISEKQARSLRAGEPVLLSGRILTARDAAHAWLASGKKKKLELNAIYHCGPIARREGKSWRILSAGPTTSMRMEPYEAEAIKRNSIRVIIGKGGMGERTRRALKRFGCAYLQVVGGAGALLAKKIARVAGVRKLGEFGAPEAIWKLEVKDFPAVVAMDARGNSIYRQVEAAASKRLARLFSKAKEK